MKMSEEQLNTAWYSVPLYRGNARYAKEHSEIDLFRTSHKANIACRDAIAAVIQEYFDGMRLSEDAAKGVLAEFGPERVSHVLAATLLDKLHDQRISDANMAWAKLVPTFDTGSRHYDYAVSGHSVKLDAFVTLVRMELAAQEPQKLSVKERLAAKPVPGDRPKDKPHDSGTR